MNDTIDIKITDKEKIFVDRLLDIAQMCIRQNSDNCIYHINSRIGNINVRLEFSYEIKEDAE